MSFFGRVGTLFEMYDGSCGVVGVEDVEKMGMMVVGVVTVGAAAELLGRLLGRLLDCGRLRWGPARDAVKVGSARAEMMEAEVRETRGVPMEMELKCQSGIVRLPVRAALAGAAKKAGVEAVQVR